MIAFVFDDSPDNIRRRRINRCQRQFLLGQMQKDNLLDGHSGRRNGLRSGKACEQAQHQPTKPAEVVAAAPPSSAPSKFRAEQRTVVGFVSEKTVNLGNQRR